MKLIRLILATTPALLLATVTPPVRSASPEFYVVPHGADTWSGTRPEPNPDKTDAPFATLARGRAGHGRSGSPWPGRRMPRKPAGLAV
ncbi:MAG TPA: hypothetical protein PK640_09005 [Verrucomicrobiota bacterium]|nr:hypothetical protein [Verrucomicrobiota bacterium]